MRVFALLSFLLGYWPTIILAQELPAVPTPVSSAGVEQSPILGRENVTTNLDPGSVFGIDLLIGQQTGIRPSVSIFNTERSALFLEGYYGGLFSKFGASETAGAGARWVTTRPGVDSISFGPGVDVLFHFNRGQGVILAPTVDVAWKHNFGERASFLLGINAGVGVGLSGREQNRHGDPISGKLTPLISFYTGFRF